MTETLELDIGEGLQLSINGAPKERISPEVQVEALLAVIRHCLPFEQGRSIGPLADIQNVILYSDSEEFTLDLQLRSTYLITRYEIRQAASQWIESLQSTSTIDIQIAREGLISLSRAITGEVLDEVEEPSTQDSKPGNLIHLEPDIYSSLFEEVKLTGNDVEELVNEIIRRSIQLKLPLLVKQQRRIERSVSRRGHFLSIWSPSHDNVNECDLWKSICLRCGRYVEVNNEGEIIADDLESLCIDV